MVACILSSLMGHTIDLAKLFIHFLVRDLLLNLQINDKDNLWFSGVVSSGTKARSSQCTFPRVLEGSCNMVFCGAV